MIFEKVVNDYFSYSPLVSHPSLQFKFYDYIPVQNQQKNVKCVQS